jgi:hypothetical protein
VLGLIATPYEIGDGPPNPGTSPAWSSASINDLTEDSTRLNGFSPKMVGTTDLID